MMSYPLRSQNTIPQAVKEYRTETIEKERVLLAPKAARSVDHQRLEGTEDDHRLPYKRDVDRIVHSKAYSRYVDKTQVVYLVENDHVTHRSLHVQLVSNFARGIAEILHLNLDLVEAIALGHDVGHPPFGHEGEGYLSDLSEKYGNGKFAHPSQSCRLFSEIESLNLGLLVYDGFLCHDGGMCGTCFEPNLGKTWDDHFREREEKLADPEANIWPGSLEGCLVKMCDTISYVGRDIEDAISLNILTRDQIPETILGRSNRELLSVAAKDIIEHSYNKGVIAMSQQVYEALQELRSFNFQHIYTHPKLKIESEKIRRSYEVLFETLLEEHQQNSSQSYLWKHFLRNKSEKYLQSSSSVQLVVDFISGMTDNFFVNTLENIIVPKQIHIE